MSNSEKLLGKSVCASILFILLHFACCISLVYFIDPIYLHWFASMDAVNIHPCEKSFVLLKRRLLLAKQWMVLPTWRIHKPLLWIHGTLSEQEIFGKREVRVEKFKHRGFGINYSLHNCRDATLRCMPHKLGRKCKHFIYSLYGKLCIQNTHSGCKIHSTYLLGHYRQT